MTVFYTPSGNPATGASGLSATMRSEFVAIQVAFAAVAPYTDAATAANAMAASSIGRNRLHNAGFRTNQRGYAGAALGALAYGHDRWRAGGGGCTYSVGASGNNFTATITAGTLIQVIEATNVEGGSYVLSWAGTAQGRFGTTVLGASPQTVTGVPANATMNVVFSTGTVTNPQVEPGLVASSFEQPTIEIELAVCQRYFLAGSVKAATYAGGAGGVTGAFYAFPVTMRAAPTMAIAGAAYTNGSAGALTGYADGYQPAWTATGAGATAFTGTFTASADL